MRPNCNNCRHSGGKFKINKLTHTVCLNEELYPDEAETSPWDTLREWWDKCKKHEFKPKEEVTMPVYNQGDQRQKIQVCVNCGDPTERCEDDALYITVNTPDDLAGPFCEICFDHSKPWVTDAKEEVKE